MDTTGQIPEFQPQNERISAYLDIVELFFAGNDVKPAKKVAILLSAIGGKAYSFLRDHLAPALPSAKTFEQL